jgi:hypothetical protein
MVALVMRECKYARRVMRFFSRASRDALALEEDDGPLPRYESALPVVSERLVSGWPIFSPESAAEPGTEDGGEVYVDVGTVRAVRSFGGGGLTACSGCALRS